MPVMSSLDIAVDRASSSPLHQQLSDALRSAITDGTLKPGDRVENEVELASRLGLSRPTVRRAMEDLVRSGLVTRRRGSGTVVSPTQVHRQVRLSSLFDDLATEGHAPTTKVLEFSISPGSAEVLDMLQLPDGSDVLTIRRLRLVAGEPLALMTNQLPADLAPDYRSLVDSGLYASLRRLGVTIAGATQRIGACPATAAWAELLDERPGSPLLTLDRLAHDSSGRIVEHGAHLYRASRYTFDMAITH